jgi:hypothetical protein
MIHFKCPGCGRQIQAHVDASGRSMQCPGCKKAVTVPGQDAVIPPARVPLAAPPARAVAPARAPAQPLPRWLVPAVLAVIVLTLGAAGVWWFWKPGLGGPHGDGPEVTDLQLLPADAQTLVSVRLAELWGKPAVQKAIAGARGADPMRLDLAGQLERELGFRPEDVERLHGVRVDPLGGTWWMVIRTVSPVDRKKLLGRLTGPVEREYANRRYYLGKTSEDRALAVHVAATNVVVIGNETGMKSCLQLPAAPIKAGPLAPIIALLDGKSQGVAGYNPQVGGVPSFRGNPLAQTLGADMLRQAEMVRATLDVHDQAVLEVRARMKDEPAAKGGKEQLATAISNAQPMLLLMGLAASKEQAKRISLLSGLLTTLKPEAKGNEVIVTGKADPAMIVELMRLVPTQ